MGNMLMLVVVIVMLVGVVVFNSLVLSGVIFARLAL